MKKLVFDRGAPWILIFLTAALPLAFDFSLSDTFDLPKMSLVYAASLVLFALWFWQQSSGGWVFRPTGMVVPVMIFLGVAWVSSHSSIDSARSLFGAYRTYVYGCLPMTVFAVLFFLTSQVASDQIMHRVITAAVLSSALCASYGVLQYTGNEIFDVMPAVVHGRVWSSMGNPIYFGAICMMALPLACSRILSARSTAGAFPYGLAASVLLSGLLISQSRSAWIGGLIGLVLVSRHDRRFWKLFGGMVVLVCLLGTLIRGTRERAWVLLAPQEYSNRARLEGWKGGIEVWWHHPVLGSGPDTFFDAFRPYRTRTFIQSAGAEVTQAHAHNEIIQFASTLGTAGLGAWILVLWAFLKRLKCQALYHGKVPGTFPDDERIPIIASLAAIFIQNQFNPPSAASAAWMVIFAGLIIHHGPMNMKPRHPWPLWGRIAVVGSLLGMGLWAIHIPPYADYRYKEGVVMDARGQTMKALDCYRDAVRMRPDIEVYQTALGNSARSLAQLTSSVTLRQQFWNEAWSAAQSSVKRHPANPDTWNDLGVAAMWLTQQAGMDRMSEAKSAFDRAIALDPVFVDAWANIAKWYHIAGQLDAEKETWKVVLSLDPGHPMALQVLGQTPKVPQL